MKDRYESERRALQSAVKGVLATVDGRRVVAWLVLSETPPPVVHEGLAQNAATLALLAQQSRFLQMLNALSPEGAQTMLLEDAMRIRRMTTEEKTDVSDTDE